MLFKYFKTELGKGRESLHFIGRMILILKDKTELPSLNNIRGITISSNIIKTLELIILNRIKHKLLDKIH